MQHYSFLNLLRRSWTAHRSWTPAWRSASPKKHYDVVIIGGGGHGLATAYYLASKHGIHNVAVLEKGWIGGGNSGRNTQVVRSNYFYPESTALFEHSLKLYERLGQELNFNVMLSQRGIMILAHSLHEMENFQRWVNALRLNGIDSEELTPKQITELEPLINLDARFPIVGGFIQHRAGIARHDAVVWGFARAADALGVDIIQNCMVNEFQIALGRVHGVRTSQGEIGAGRVGIAVAGHSSEMARLAGFRLPITSMALQAMVTEPIKPVLNTVVLSPTIHVYVSQSDRGEIVIGAGADRYTSYAQRGGIPTIQENIAALLELFPSFSRLKLMRQWAGIVDISPDSSPIIGATPVRGLYINCGWGTGGFKAIPVGGETFAYTLAHGEPHPLVTPFGLERFVTGALVDENAAAGVAH